MKCIFNLIRWENLTESIFLSFPNNFRIKGPTAGMSTKDPYLLVYVFA